MAIRTVRRCGAALLLATLAISGCSITGGSSMNPFADMGRDDDCEAEPSKCRYEPGEREFAEQEAKRLNRESAERLRRSFRR